MGILESDHRQIRYSVVHAREGVIMNGRQTWVIGAAILLGCLILGVSIGRPATANPRDVPVTPGRYQLIPISSGGEEQATDEMIVIDTATGQCWQRSGDKWKNLGSPVKARK
jgi:hypothetical protein